MTFKAIDVSLITQQFPQITEMTFLASGGFKGVYRAKVEDRIEAVKVIMLEKQQDPDAEELLQEQVARVRREVEVLEKCTVPELVKLGKIPLTPFLIGNDYYLIYSEEFLKGPDLMKLVHNSEEWPTEKELRRLFLSLLKAIKALWTMGYVHRDIKPNNVIKLVDPERPFVLLDLGIAFAVHETGLTVQTQFAPATIKYIAPEMLQPNFRENLDYRSDLYTAAMTVYEYGSKQHPLAKKQDDFTQTLSRALRQIPDSLSLLRPDLDKGFCDLIVQMLKKKPALRPANLDRLMTFIGKGIDE